MKINLKAKIVFLLFAGSLALAATSGKNELNIGVKDMVLVPGSTFKMGLDSIQLQNEMKEFNGSPEMFSQEYPAFRVTVQPFFIDKHEVTNAEYKKFINANPEWSKSNIPDSLQDGNYLKDWNGNKYPKLMENYPVVYISFYAAKAYANWKGKRLPTETEYESAAKGIDKSVEYSWDGNSADTTKTNFLASNIGHAVSVGHYEPNSLGLFDINGNVSEFVQDSWRQNFYTALAQIEKKTAFKRLPKNDGKNKVIRGANWNSPAVNLRTTFRDKIAATACNAYVGFRCAASVSVNK